MSRKNLNDINPLRCLKLFFFGEIEFGADTQSAGV